MVYTRVFQLILNNLELLDLRLREIFKRVPLCAPSTDPQGRRSNFDRELRGPQSSMNHCGSHGSVSANSAALAGTCFKFAPPSPRTVSATRSSPTKAPYHHRDLQEHTLQEHAYHISFNNSGTMFGFLKNTFSYRTLDLQIHCVFLLT